MNLIICIDNKGGMLFHGRRVSSDRIVCKKILDLCQGKLRIAPYSMSLFQTDCELFVSEDLSDATDASDWCFVETFDPAKVIDNAEKIVIFHWNRSYPSELKFTMDKLRSGWILNHTEEFEGYSHKKITMEVYLRC